MSNTFVDSAAFIRNRFLEDNLVEVEIPNEHQSTVFIYRTSPDDRLFILVSIGYDFRDPEWSITLKAGSGFPEQAVDPVEFQLASISLVELGVLSKRTEYLPKDIGNAELRHQFEPGLAYCLNFINGDSAEPLQKLKHRNEIQLLDPLNLSAQTPQARAGLQERNEELKTLLKKYL